MPEGFAGVLKLVDKPDLGSGAQAYGFESLHPHYKKPRGEAEKPYGSERLSGTGITLITPVMAANSLNLAEMYSLVGSHTDKSDNLHLNGDYHKMLVCSH